MSLSPYKKNRVGFSILRQIFQPFLLCWYLHQPDEETQFGKARQGGGGEISLTSLTICLITLTKRAKTCAIFDECFLSRNFQSRDRDKQGLYQMVYHQNATSRSNSAKSLRVIICVHRI